MENLSKRLLYITILLMPFDIFQYGTLNLRPWNFTCTLGFIVLVFNRFIKGKNLAAPYGWLFFLYFSANVLSIFNSISITDSVLQLIKLIMIDLPLYLLIVNELRTEKDFVTALKLLSITALYVGGFGIIQMVALWVFKINLMPWKLNMFGPPAWFTEKTWYGNYLTMIFAYCLCARPLFFKQHRFFEKIFMGFLLGCILFSSSRSAIFSAGAIFFLYEIFMFFKAPARKIGQLIIVILAIVCLIFVVNFQSQRISLLFSDRDNLDRTSVVNMALLAIAAHPIIGNGIATWGTQVGADNHLSATFNIFLTALYDGGYVVLSILIFSIIAISICLIKTLDNTRLSSHRFIVLSAIYGFLVVLIISQFHPYYLSGYAWLALSIAAATRNLLDKRFN